MNKQCKCSRYHWQCTDTNATGTTPPRLITNTTDVLFDISDVPTNEWLLQTHNDFINSRFGGWSASEASEADGLDPWINGSNINLIAWYNNKAIHALPAFTNALHNAMLRSMVVEKDDDTYGISTFSHPLRVNTGQLNSQTL